MYEIFPIVAGAIIALLVPRFVAGKAQRWVMAVAGVGAAALATIMASEEWFFILIDLALVFAAMAATLYIARAISERNTLRMP